VMSIWDEQEKGDANTACDCAIRSENVKACPAPGHYVG
jgi:hypothetical protein